LPRQDGCSCGPECAGRPDTSLPVALVVVARIRFYRDGLSELLGSRQGLRVLATAADGVTGLRCIDEHRPDIVLVGLGPGTGMQLVEEILALAPETRVVVLDVAEDDPEILSLAEVGVAGYVTIDASGEELVGVVESVARGEMLCSPKIAAALLRRVAALAAERRPAEGIGSLTPREREIVELIDLGRSNKEIARDLMIEVATVKNHVHNILEKLNVTRRGEAAAVLRRV
jgi:two-component system, NarL family, nitrate/nitrite response regulator NarL